MLTKIITLVFSFVLFFLFQGVSQTTDKSAHPLLDKYYPHQQDADTNTTANKTKVAPAFTTAPAETVLPSATPVSVPPVTPTATTTSPAVITTRDMTDIPGETNTPPLSTSPSGSNLPTNVATPSANVSPADLTTVDKTNIPGETSEPSLTTTPAVNKPTIVTAELPILKKEQPKPVSPTPYIDTRLGSSSPQYDTWEKNNNGAGSVTTSPK